MKDKLKGKYEFDGFYVIIKGHMIFTDKNDNIVDVQDCDFNYTLEEFLNMVIKKDG